jgi:two-component system chemotaxis sensor kinase CheA
MSDRVLQEFLSEAQEIVENLNRDLLGLDAQRESGRFDPDIVNDVFRAVHSLKGLAGLFAVGPMTRLSHHLESVLDAVRLGKIKIKPEVLDLLFEAVEVYGQLIGDLSSGRPADEVRVETYIAALDELAGTLRLPSTAGRRAAPPSSSIPPSSRS